MRGVTLGAGPHPILHHSHLTWTDSTDVSIGTGEDHPDSVRVTLNTAAEIGLIEKQAAFYFQGLSSRAVVVGNVEAPGITSI